MEDKVFDKILKDKLEQIRTPYDASSWQTLSDKLDKTGSPATGAEADLDAMARKALANKEMPFNTQHWNLMAQRLDRTNLLLRRLRTAKIAEAAILILTLLNLDAFKPENPIWQTPKPKVYQGPIAASQPKQEQTTDLQSGVASTQQMAATEVSSVKNSASTPQKLMQAKASKQMSGDLVSQNLANTLATSQASVQQLVGTNTANASSQVEQNKQESTLADLAHESTARAPIANFAQIQTLQAGLIEPKAVQLGTPPMFTPSANQAKLYASVYTGPDYIRVSGQNDDQVFGYTAGISIGKRKGKWGLESGIEYSSMKYAVTPEKEIIAGNPQKGVVGRVLRTIDYDIVSLPLRVSRSIFKSGKTDIRVQAGTQVMAIAQISPDYNSFYTPGSTPAGQGSSGVLVRSSIDTDNRGLFEGGDIADNMHLAANGGIRAEQLLHSGSKKLFLEINGQSLVMNKTLAPASDQISSIGLRAGLIAYL